MSHWPTAGGRMDPDDESNRLLRALGFTVLQASVGIVANGRPNAGDWLVLVFDRQPQPMLTEWNDRSIVYEIGIGRAKAQPA